MDVEELLRTVDFSKYAAAHKEALRKLLFGKSPKNRQTREGGRENRRGRELTLDDLEYVTAAGKTWIDSEEKFPSK